MSYQDLTTGDIRLHIRRLAIPAAVGFFCHTLYNMTDTFYAGFIGTGAQSSLAFAFPMFFILLSFCVGIGQTVTAHTANALGADKRHRAAYYVGQGVVLVFVVNVAIWLVLLPMTDSIVGLMGATGAVRQQATQYSLIIFAGAPLFLLSFLINGALQALGNTTAFRNSVIGAVLLNIVLDPILMFGWLGLPALGVAGVAWATVISEGLGLVYLLWVVSRTVIGENFRWVFCSPRFSLLIRLAHNGLAPTARMLGIGLFFFFVTGCLGRLDIDAVAAYGIALRVEQMFILPTIGLEVALLAFAGQNLGAAQAVAARQGYYACIRYGLLVAAVGGVLIFTVGDFLIAPFSGDERVRDYGVVYLRFAAVAGLCYVVVNLAGAVLIAGLKVKAILFVSLARLLVLPAFFFWLFVIVLDGRVNGIWWGILLSNAWAAWWLHRRCELLLVDRSAVAR